MKTAKEQKDACNRLLMDIESEMRAIEEKSVQALDDYERMDLLMNMKTIVKLCMKKAFDP